MKKRILVIVCAAVALAFWTRGLALADNGPHGSYGATTDACAGCHRTHTATGPKLLAAASATALCITCHGSAASGADTNVVDGIYATRDGNTESPTEGDADRGLRAGGFTNAKMNREYDGPAVSESSTSNHLIDGSLGTAWGNDGAGSGVGTSISLSCISCHDPHGGAGTGHTATYRILRARPTGSGAGSDVVVTDQPVKLYTVSDAENLYYGESYGTRATSLANWCSQCHTRYKAGAGSGSNNSGDPNFMYRHLSSSANVACLTCHVAHGTSARMGGYSGSAAWPGGGTMVSGNARSSLLRVDNRGVCELCHAK